MRILSGIQPSGELHLGNYFGALRQHVALQEKGEAIYFLADYHSMTSVRDAAERRRLVREAALDYLHQRGDYDQSSQVFLQASRLLDDTDFISISEQSAALAINDWATTYRGEYAERLWIHTYQMMNFLLLGKAESAGFPPCPGPGCVTPDNGPPPTTLPAGFWGQEKEVVRIDRLRSSFAGVEGANSSDWYYPISGLSVTSVSGCAATTPPFLSPMMARNSPMLIVAVLSVCGMALMMAVRTPPAVNSRNKSPSTKTAASATGYETPIPMTTPKVK